MELKKWKRDTANRLFFWSVEIVAILYTSLIIPFRTNNTENHSVFNETPLVRRRITATNQITMKLPPHRSTAECEGSRRRMMFRKITPSSRREWMNDWWMLMKAESNSIVRRIPSVFGHEMLVGVSSEGSRSIAWRASVSWWI